MRLPHILLSALLCLPVLMQAQSLSPVVRGTLPITESSGIEALGRNSLWTHNDSGGEPALMEVDSLGALLRTVQVRLPAQVDWEDVARDAAGHLFVGDFGNNAQNRTDLVIYRLPLMDTLTADSVDAEAIHFSYPDQDSFPPPVTDRNFDAEALVHLGGHLYIFTKDQSDPYTGWTKLYRLPDTAGTYVAELLDSFNTGTGPWFITSVTAAGLSPDGSQLALLAAGHLWHFSGYSGDDFFGGTMVHYTLTGFSQKEAVCWVSETELYLTDELFSGIGGKLYYVNLSPPVTAAPSTEGGRLLAWPNPFGASLEVQIPPAVGLPARVEIWDAQGRRLHEAEVWEWTPRLEIPPLPSGHCLLRVQGRETVSAWLWAKGEN